MASDLWLNFPFIFWFLFLVLFFYRMERIYFSPAFIGNSHHSYALRCYTLTSSCCRNRYAVSWDEVMPIVKATPAVCSEFGDAGLNVSTAWRLSTPFSTLPLTYRNSLHFYFLLFFFNCRSLLQLSRLLFFFSPEVVHTVNGSQQLRVACTTAVTLCKMQVKYKKGKAFRNRKKKEIKSRSSSLSSLR